MTVRQLADQLDVAPGAIRSVLCRHRAEFSEPSYRRRNGHPRLVRILTLGEAGLVRLLMGFPDKS